MTKDKIKVEVFKIIDVYSLGLNNTDYTDLLDEIINDCKVLKAAFEETNDGSGD